MSTDESPKALSLSEELALAEQAEEVREKMRADARARARLEFLTLKSKYERELGPIGQEFQIVDASELGEGFIVLRRGEEVLWKRYSKLLAKESETAADTRDFVLPCIEHPAKEKYDEIVARRAFIADRCANALSSLYGVKHRKEEGKF